MSRALPASPATIRKSSWRPIRAGSASRRSSSKTGASDAEMSLADDDIVLLLKALRAEQFLGEQHRYGPARLEHHGQCSADRSQSLGRGISPQARHADGL